MVKNKKMSKSAVAIIVLALLLVLSMVMGLTGAWFTQSGKSDGQTKTLNFGHIVPGANGLVSNGGIAVTTADVKAVPGDKVDLTGVAIDYTANVDTFLFIETSYSFTIQYKNEATAHEANAQEIEELFGDQAKSALEALTVLTLDDGAGIATCASGKYGTMGDNDEIAYYLFEADGGNDYHVLFNGGSTVNLVVESTVSNVTGDALVQTLPQGKTAHDWSDAVVSIAFQVKAKVIQANNLTGVENNAAVATRAAAAYNLVAYPA